MAKIMGNIVGLPSPRSDWSQTNETKADYIKNKPTKLSQFENDESYVKNTNYATWNKGGVVITPTSYGTEVNNKGQLRIVAATEDDIHGLTHKYKPIVPANLETAVSYVNNKKGMATQTYVDNAVSEVEAKIPDVSGFVTTEQLNTVLGDIEAALDKIIALQNKFIGGDTR